MDKSEAAINAIKLINQAKVQIALRPLMIKAVCSYFDLMKDNNKSPAFVVFPLVKFISKIYPKLLNLFH